MPVAERFMELYNKNNFIYSVQVLDITQKIADEMGLRYSQRRRKFSQILAEIEDENEDSDWIAVQNSEHNFDLCLFIYRNCNKVLLEQRIFCFSRLFLYLFFPINFYFYSNSLLLDTCYLNILPYNDQNQCF